MYQAQVTVHKTDMAPMPMDPLGSQGRQILKHYKFLIARLGVCREL